jgi:tol-pal system protein YbgF
MKMKHYMLLGSLSMLLAFQLYAEVPIVEDSHNYSSNQQQDEPFIAEKPVANVDVANSKYDNDVTYQESDESVPAQADNALLLSKLNALQQELQELRGQIEVQAHDLKLLQQQQLAFYKDLDSRINEAVNQDSKPLDVADNTNVKKEDKPLANSQEPKKVVAKVKSSNPAEEQISYVAAYELIKKKDYEQATTAMSSFLSNYPNSNYSANAHYWLGELFLLKQDYDSALTQFNEVLNKYPDSSKTAASMLKLGFAYAAKGDIDQARKYLRQVQQQYPDTSTAQLAKSKLAVL